MKCQVQIQDFSKGGGREGAGAEGKSCRHCEVELHE